ncbi:MAG: AAA family ATPase, partial [Bacteroidia bacterium]|nr:AAA family ATPase [Bacteroidia bacterium]
PDYLVDITTIAECAVSKGIDGRIAIPKWFESRTLSIPMLRGVVVNQLLDELARSAALGNEFDFEKYLKEELFPSHALAISLLLQNSENRKNWIQEVKTQYQNLRSCILGNGIGKESEFSKKQIDISHSILEPTFISARYGLNGRLDLLHVSNKHSRINIIELKGGTSPKTSAWPNHIAQARLYELLIEKTAEAQQKANIAVHILYSNGKDSVEGMLRKAGNPDKLKNAAFLNARNQIVLWEMKLANSQSFSEIQDNFFDFLNVSDELKPSFDKGKDYELKRSFEQALPEMQQWFLLYLRFLFREKRLQKIGGEMNRLSAADLWRLSETEKREGYGFIADLELSWENDTEEVQEEQTLVFRYTTEDVALSNLRPGTNVVVYPKVNERWNPEWTQLVKGQIQEIDTTKIVVYVRHRQFQDEFFGKPNQRWAIEPDILDMTANQCQALVTALQLSPEQQNIWLGIQPPKTKRVPLRCRYVQEPYLKQRIEKALNAENYFLLFGPPGTGKTSQFLKNLVQEIYTQTDEICDKLTELGYSFLRIGSRVNTAERHQPSLLQKAFKEFRTVQELTNHIQQTRIIVGTIAAIDGKPEIFQLKTFDRVIIDEASQALEIQLIGILSKVPRFILIGDHRQLPAVVLQSNAETEISSPELQSIGYQNLRFSLFERLFFRCQSQGWNHAWDMLTRQGRMHSEIAAFVSI